MFGLVIFLFLIAMGISIDFLRANRAQGELQSSLDAAVLAGVAADGAMAVEKANSVFSQSLQASLKILDEANINSSFGAGVPDGFQGTASTSINTLFLGVIGRQSIPIDATARAVLGVADELLTAEMGCVFLTDPVHIGLEMQGGSDFQADCTLQITTDTRAIVIGGGSNAELGGICAIGSIEVNSGTLTPSNVIPGCIPTVDPFGGLAAPTETLGGCATTDNFAISANNFDLAPGIHCGLVTVLNGGEVTLEEGIHIFRGGLDINAGGTVLGDDVLLVFEEVIDDYNINGTLDVSGLQTGDYQGFVIFHEKYFGTSNSLNLANGSSFTAEGVIYIPNTHIIVKTNANELATRSILVTDRFELDNNASFKATILETSTTPLPLALTETTGVGFPRLVE